MALLDKVPGDLNIYIGGLFTLRRKDAMRAANITHVLSVIRMRLDEEQFGSFKHMHVEVDDVEDENLLEHFPATNRFIQDALDQGGGVLVHCAMGKSRSASCVIAFLMHRYHVAPDEALEQIRQSRPFCGPNEGFMAQLWLYHDMCTPEDMDSAPAYQRWLYHREVELSLAAGQAPEADKIRFEDEQAQKHEAAAADFELRCRKCRRALATSQYLVVHKTPTQNASATAPAEPSSPGTPSADCSHFFLDPLSWMRPELEKGKLDGRLECPKCRTNVGKYAWQGMRCSCSKWVVPGISLGKSRVDQATRLNTGSRSSGHAIRRPPAIGSRGNSGNL